MQAGILANKLLKKRLQSHGYYKVPNTQGLFKRTTKPIQFTLVVNDFGVKYIGWEHAQHLANMIKQNYTILEDWEGKLYCGVSLNWNYEQQYVNISMPGYIVKVLQKFNHDSPPHPQHSPYLASTKKYGKEAQTPIPPDTSNPLKATGITKIQQMVGSLFYYGRAIYITILTALNHIGAEQATATANAYCARSRASGHFFLGWLPQHNKPIRLNGSIHNLCKLLKFVASSAAEAE